MKVVFAYETVNGHGQFMDLQKEIYWSEKILKILANLMSQNEYSENDPLQFLSKVAVSSRTDTENRGLPLTQSSLKIDYGWIHE